MGTIEDKLRYLMGTKKAIKDAIISKGVLVSDEDSFRSYADKIADIDYSAEVKFYDTDGTILYKYTPSDALNLTEMPIVPEKEGYIAQGWNFSFEDFRYFVENYGVCNVGAMYITDDGKTRLHIVSETSVAQDVTLYFSQTISNGVTIDWGDGSQPETVEGTGNLTAQHSLSGEKEYIISLAVAEGCQLGFGHGSSANVLGGTSLSAPNASSMLVSVDFGEGVDTISTYGFRYCPTLRKVTIPQGITQIGSYAFYQCEALEAVIIPQGITQIGNSAFYSCVNILVLTFPATLESIGAYAFYLCRALVDIILPVTTLNTNAFYYCYALRNVIIPEGITTIPSNCFVNCYSLQSITTPTTLVSIGSTAFSGCYGLRNLTIKPIAGKLVFNTNAFSSCYSLQKVITPDQGITYLRGFGSCYSITEVYVSYTSVDSNLFQACSGIKKAEIADGVTSLGSYMFDRCTSLEEVVLPDTLTSLSTYTFRECRALKKISIPPLVTSVGSYTFSACYALKLYDFSRSTKVPSLANTTNAITINAGMSIVVPDELYNSWIAATNWSTLTSYIIKKSDFDNL